VKSIILTASLCGGALVRLRAWRHRAATTASGLYSTSSFSYAC